MPEKEMSLAFRKFLESVDKTKLEPLKLKASAELEEMEKRLEKTRKVASPIILAHIITHPSRWSIVKALEKATSPLSYRKIADLVGLERRLVTFHLMFLDQYGLVDRDFMLLEPDCYDKEERRSKRRIAVSCFKLTDKCRTVLGYLNLPS